MTILRSWNVLSWNIRGLNSEPKQLALHNDVLSSGCSIICLQETKKTSFDLAFIKSCCPRQFDKFAFVPSQGASGGLVTIWKSSMFTGTIMVSESFALVINLSVRRSHSPGPWPTFTALVQVMIVLYIPTGCMILISRARVPGCPR